jgi:PKD repeat protein
MSRAVAIRGVALLVVWAGLCSALLAQGTSTLQNPAASFATVGPHTVTMTACNIWGCQTMTKTVTVLDPKPSVTSASAGVLIVEAGQLVPLSGSGKGQPPLGYSWRVFQGTDLIQEVAGASPLWQTAGLAPGVYTPVLRITNASGMAESLPQVVTVVAPRALDFYTVSPCRALDTRFGSPLGVGAARIIDLTGTCDIPTGARAVAANVTIPSPTLSGSVSLYPGNYPNLGTSTINFSPGVTLANNAILTLSTDGTTTLAASTNIASGTVNLVIDITGYFVPEI